MALAALACIALYRLHPLGLRWAAISLYGVALVAFLDTLIHFFTAYGRRSYLGCDISPWGIHYVQLRGGKGRIALVAHDSLEMQRQNEFIARYRSRWRRFPVYGACTGELLIFRELEIPSLTPQEAKAALPYELEYQFSWYNENWVTTSVELATDLSDTQALTRLMVVFMKKEELDQQYNHLRRLGLSPQSIELRATAIFRAAFPLLPPNLADTLVIERLGEQYICSRFHQRALMLHHLFGSEYLTSLLQELQGSNITCFQSLIYIDAEDNDNIAGELHDIQRVLLSADLLETNATVLSGENILQHHFKDAGKATSLTPRQVVALGLALREVEDAV